MSISPSTESEKVSYSSGAAYFGVETTSGLTGAGEEEVSTGDRHQIWWGVSCGER